MLKNHFAHCFVGIVAAVGLLLIFGVRAGTLLYLVAVLACPLVMPFMMRAVTATAARTARTKSTATAAVRLRRPGVRDSGRAVAIGFVDDTCAMA